jgi:hypothetical protein
MKTDAELEQAGEAAVAEGLRLWGLNVGDPAARFLIPPHPGADTQYLAMYERASRWREVIDEVYKAAGWGAATPYAGNGVGNAAQWCGFFGAACWRAAGIDPKWLAPFFASTVRLYNWARYLPFNQHKNDPAPKDGEPRRLIAKLGPDSTPADLPFPVRQGDIVIIGGPHDRPEDRIVGRHITIARGVDLSRRVILTVEANAFGTLHDGRYGEGIVISERKIGGAGDHVMWIYRPAPNDLELAVG